MAQTLGPQFELVSSVARLFPRRTSEILQDVSAAVPFSVLILPQLLMWSILLQDVLSIRHVLSVSHHRITTCLAQSLSIAAGWRGTVLYICQETRAVRHGKLPRSRPRLSVSLHRRPLRR